MTNEQLRKAAVLVSALDAETADVLLERMSPVQAGALRRVLLELDRIEDAEQQAIVAEFVGRPAATTANEDVEVSVSRHAAAAYAAEKQAGDAPFRFLHEADGEDLSELLIGEHPQTIAVVLSHLPADRAAAAVATLSDALQADVVRRLAKLDETDPTVLRDVEKELESRFRRRFRDDSGRAVGVGAVRNILSEAPPSIRRSLLTSLSKQDPQLAARLDARASAPPFTAADLPRLSAATLRELCDELDQEILAVALAGGDLELTRRFLAALPRGRAAQLQAAIDTLGPTPLSDVEWAQSELLRVAGELTAGRNELSAA